MDRAGPRSPRGFVHDSAAQPGGRRSSSRLHPNLSLQDSALAFGTSERFASRGGSRRRFPGMGLGRRNRRLGAMGKSDESRSLLPVGLRDEERRRRLRRDLQSLRSGSRNAPRIRDAAPHAAPLRAPRHVLSQVPAIVIRETRNVGVAIDDRRSRSFPMQSMRFQSSMKFKLIVISETGNVFSPFSIQKPSAPRLKSPV